MQKRDTALKFTILFIFFLVPPSVLSQSPDACLHSFQRFAYEGPRDPDETLQAPLPPWKPVPEVMNTSIDTDVSILDVVFAHSHLDQPELWISGSSGDQLLWMIYSPQTSKIKFVSREIDGTDLLVHNLYVDSQGTLWGSLLLEPTSHAKTVPVLSRFNESQRRFELIEDMLEVPSTQPGFDEASIVQTSDGILWILVSNDGLYAFKPDTQTFRKRADLTGIDPLQATAAVDDTLYFSTSLGDPREQGYATLQQVRMYQFIPQTDELIQVELPQNWPSYSGLHFDHERRLWLGVVGFRDEDEKWNLIYPDPERFIRSPLILSRTMPTLVFESSDGRLWYTNWWDGGIWDHGTAWFDPKTGEGCMFTNMASSIVEDSEGHLWLVANSTLYKYTHHSQ